MIRTIIIDDETHCVDTLVMLLKEYCPEVLPACHTLKEAEEQLRDFSYFVRVHHSWLVNLNEVTEYIRGESDYVIMSDGSAVNGSRSGKEALLK